MNFQSHQQYRLSLKMASSKTSTPSQADKPQKQLSAEMSTMKTMKAYSVTLREMLKEIMKGNGNRTPRQVQSVFDQAESKRSLLCAGITSLEAEIAVPSLQVPSMRRSPRAKVTSMRLSSSIPRIRRWLGTASLRSSRNTPRIGLTGRYS